MCNFVLHFLLLKVCFALFQAKICSYSDIFKCSFNMQKSFFKLGKDNITLAFKFNLSSNYVLLSFHLIISR